MKINGLRISLLATAAMAVVHPAFAQDDNAGNSADGSALEQVTVTGIHASNERSIQIKHLSDQIVDSVSATDIGQLPDFNAGDALKRVPGVAALLYQGEPRFLIVRGMNANYNDLLIDGFSFAATDINMGESNTSGRQVDMELLPSNLAAHIDVVKTATPSTDGNFIGGLTNFVTASAYDFKDGALSASVSGGAAIQPDKNGGDKPTAQAQVSYATQFGPANQFGLYLSATYWMRNINVPQLEAGGSRNWYTAAGVMTSTPYGGTGYAVPSQRLFYNYENNRDRLGLQARLDWHPAANIAGYISAYHFHQDEYSDRNDLNAAVQSSSKDLNQTATTGTLTNVSQDMQLGRYRWHRDMYGLYGRLSADLGNGWKVDGGSSWSLGTVFNPQTTDLFTQSNMSFTYDTSGFAPVFTAVSAANASNYALYPLTQHQEQDYFLNENRFDEQLNVGYNADPDDRGFGFKAGLRYSADFQHVRVAQTAWSKAPYTLADVLSGQTLCGYGCNTPIPLISPALADKYFNEYKATMTAAPNVSSQQGGTYHSREQVASGYVQAQWQGDDWLIIGGIRAEGTFAGSSGTESVGGVYQPITVSNQYANVLPSILGVYDTSDSSKLRIGISETLARPTFGASSVHGGVLNLTANPPTLSTGNPDLKPRRAWNYDINHDWYIDGGRGIVSLGLFYKEIHNDIFSFGETENVPGVDGPVLVTESRNTDHLVTDEGFEASASENLDFLPAPFDGFGVSANATISHGKFPITLSDGSVFTMHGLPGQPSHIYNASLFYDKGAFHGRFAWNHLTQFWDDRYPNFTPTGIYANRFQQPTDNFDIQISYDVTSRIAVDVEALNITSQGMAYKYGLHQGLYQSAWDLPPEVMVGAKFRD